MLSSIFKTQAPTCAVVDTALTISRKNELIHPVLLLPAICEKFAQ